MHSVKQFCVAGALAFLSLGFAAGDAAAQQRVTVRLQPVVYQGTNSSVISLVQSTNQLLAQCHNTGTMNVRGAQQIVRSAERLAQTLITRGLEDQDMPAVRDSVQYLWLAQYNCP